MLGACDVSSEIELTSLLSGAEVFDSGLLGDGSPTIVSSSTTEAGDDRESLVRPTVNCGVAVNANNGGALSKERRAKLLNIIFQQLVSFTSC